MNKPKNKRISIKFRIRLAIGEKEIPARTGKANTQLVGVMLNGLYDIEL